MYTLKILRAGFSARNEHDRSHLSEASMNWESDDEDIETRYERCESF